MGIVYYGNYYTFFERGRTEMLRSAGFPYSKLESLGNILPVSESHCRYFSPARYDDLLTFRSAVLELSRVKIKIGTQILRDGELLASGFVCLASVDRNMRICRMHPELEAVCRQFMLEPGVEWR
jgi:acyl-CoA thioester hydrolase